MTFDGRSTARTCRAVALAQADPYELAMYYDMKQKEYDALRLRPHPYEFAMYYDV